MNMIKQKSLFMLFFLLLNDNNVVMTAARIAAPGAKPAETPTTFAATTATSLGPKTTTANGGPFAAVAGAAAAAAAAAAVAAAPKAPVRPVEEEASSEEDDEDDDLHCAKKTVSICRDDCVSTHYVSVCRIISTVSCSQKSCSTTAACNAKPSTSTAFHSAPNHKSLFIEHVPPPLTTSAPASYGVAVQAYLGKAYQRLHLEYSSLTAESKDAMCEEDLSKAVVENSNIKVIFISNNRTEQIDDDYKGYVQNFCKSNNGYSASPNKALRVPFEQQRNRTQVNLVVSYIGDRGQGATYTINEYIFPFTTTSRFADACIGKHALALLARSLLAKLIKIIHVEGTSRLIKVFFLSKLTCTRVI